jgi:glycosyltransferase involved in cell wall biosynthesis
MEETDSESSRLKVALVYYGSFPTFIKNDYEILSRHFEVKKVKISSISDIMMLAKAINWCDLSLTWFAGKHAFPAVLLSKVLGKRSIVIAGGFDVACEPEINYGQFNLPWYENMYANYALNNADAVLAVSEFIREEVLRRSNPRTLKVVYNGIDTERFKPAGEKEDLVVTVAFGSRDQVKLKGIDAFVKAAACILKVKFLVIGLREEDVIATLPSGILENVEFLGHLSQKLLINLYQRAKVYCQLSYRDSFGFAMAEAMARECVPVVTEREILCLRWLEKLDFTCLMVMVE